MGLFSDLVRASAFGRGADSLKMAEMERQAEELANRSAQIKANPLYQSVGLPSEAEDMAAKQAFLAKFANSPTAGMGENPSLSKPQATAGPVPQYISPRETYAKQHNINQSDLNLSPSVLEEVSKAQKNFTPASKKAWEQTIRDALPSMNQDLIDKTFGVGMSPDSNFMAARQTAQLNLRKDSNGKMFPIASLQPEAQQAAIRGGFGEFVPESTARLLSMGNLPKAATPEQLKDWASVDTIKSEISQIRQLSAETNYKGVGIENYYLNQLGQYNPIESLATDPKITQLYRLINDVNNKMIYLQSGKQINEAEYGRLKSTFPEPQLNAPSFVERLNGFESIFNELSGKLKSNATAAGYRGVPSIRQPTGQLPSAEEFLRQNNQPVTPANIGWARHKGYAR